LHLCGRVQKKIILPKTLGASWWPNKKTDLSDNASGPVRGHGENSKRPSLATPTKQNTNYLEYKPAHAPYL